MGYFSELDLLLRHGQSSGLFCRWVRLSPLLLWRSKPCPGLVEQHVPFSVPEASHPFVEVASSYPAFFLRAVEKQSRQKQQEAPSAGVLS